MAGNAGPIKGGSNKARECDVNQLFVIRLDPSIINGTNNGRPRAGNFHLSNPKLGEQLQHLILSSFRGPKNFDKVWPIYDSTHSRYFWKVVQSIISELESQGVLPKFEGYVTGCVLWIENGWLGYFFFDYVWVYCKLRCFWFVFN
ncbi:putative HAUS augmin-like complex subunit 6 [Helianthus debilis subsp. tardiflorus]